MISRTFRGMVIEMGVSYCGSHMSYDMVGYVDIPRCDRCVCMSHGISAKHSCVVLWLLSHSVYDEVH